MWNSHLDHFLRKILRNNWFINSDNYKVRCQRMPIRPNRFNSIRFELLFLFFFTISVAFFKINKKKWYDICGHVVEQNVGSVFISFLSKEQWSEFDAHHISIIQSNTRNKKNVNWVSIYIQCKAERTNNIIRNFIEKNLLEFYWISTSCRHTTSSKCRKTINEKRVYRCMCVCNTSATANVCVFISIAIHCYIKQYETQ